MQTYFTVAIRDRVIEKSICNKTYSFLKNRCFFQEIDGGNATFPQLQFLTHLSSGLEEILNSTQHADVTIQVDEREYPCHKVILSAMSPYFEAMFTHDMKENRESVVRLHDIEPGIFENLRTFMYTGKANVNEENAEKIFRASSLMQIPCLQQRCEDFLLSQISHENCIGIWKIAKAHACQKLSEKAWDTILENFQTVCTTEDFLRLDIDELVCILQDDNLKSPTEEFICDVAFEWIDYDKQRRRQNVCEIMPALRLPLVSSDYLFHVFYANEEVQNSPECRSVMGEALRYQSCHSKRQDFTSIRCTRRLTSKSDDVLIVIGGLLSTTPRYQTTKEVLCFSFQQQKWFYLPSLPYDPGYEFAACTHGDSIFVSGGWLKLQGLAEFKTHKNEWKICETMTNGRCGHVMVSVAHSIFVLGGRDGRAPAMTNIEEFNLQTEKWSMAGDLHIGVRSTSASTIGEKIFIFGGITESDKDTMSVQCFDTRLHCTSVIGDLPFTCRLTRTVSLDMCVYVLAPDGRVLEFCDPTLSIISHNVSRPRSRCDSSDSTDVTVTSTEPYTVTTSLAPVLGKLLCRIPNFSQHHFEVIQHRGDVLLVGGKTPDNTILKNIIQINVHNKGDDKISDQTSLEMPSARWCFGCVKTVVPRDYLNNEIRN